MTTPMFKMVRLIFLFIEPQVFLRLVYSCLPRLVCVLLSVESFFVGRPHGASYSLVTFAMLTHLVSAVGCTRIFRVPATLGVFLLRCVFSSDLNCGIADVAGSVV